MIVPSPLADEMDRLREDPRGVLSTTFLECRSRLEWTINLRLDVRLRRRIDTDDVLQEAFLVAVQRVDAYLAAPSVPIFIWLRSIVCQTIVDVHRRHLRAQSRTASRDVSLHETFLAPSTVTLGELLEGSCTSPSRAAGRCELAGQVEQALAMLDPIDREVIVLRHFEDLTNQEVADALALQASSACMRYKRAMQRMKQALCGHAYYRPAASGDPHGA